MQRKKQKPLVRFLLPLSITLSVIAVGILVLTNISSTLAATGTNQQLNYQARLLTSTGAVVADGSYNLEFKIYQDGNGVLGGGDETLRWTETRTGANTVTVKNGYFSVYLGSVTPFASNIDWNQDTLWLSVNVGGTGTPSFDGEMSPFTRLSSAPYAINSSQLGGLDKNKFVQLSQGLQVDSSTSNASIAINKTGNTANILDIQRAGSRIMLVGNTGDTVFRTSVNSTTALTVQNLANNNLLAVSTDETQPVLTVTATAGGSQAGLEVNNNTSTGSIAIFRDNGIAVVTIADGGTVSIDGSLDLNGDNIASLTGDGLAIVNNDLSLNVQANKGLEVDANGISLIDCANNQILKYNTISTQWACAADGGGGGSATLKESYDNDADGGNVIIDLTSADGGILVRDSLTGLGGVLFAVQNSLSSTNYFSVTSAGISIDGIIASTGNVNSSGGSLQTNGTTRIANNGNATLGTVSGSTITASGLITANAGVTVSPSQTFTINGDGFTDLTGDGLNITTGALTLAVQANKGLEVDGNGISIIDCAEGQVLKYSSAAWSCGDGVEVKSGVLVDATEGTPVSHTFSTAFSAGPVDCTVTVNLAGSGNAVQGQAFLTATPTATGFTVDWDDGSGGGSKTENIDWICTNGGTGGGGGGGGGSTDLDGAYANDPDKVLFINDANGLTFDLTSTGDFIIQDSSTTIANFSNNGGITFTPNGASDVNFNFDDDSQLILTGSLTNSGALEVINLAFVADGAGDSVSALNINVTSANDTTSDVVYGLNIGNLTGAGANTSERALRIGSNWDEAIDVNGTLISLAELQVLDAGISAAELDTQGAITDEYCLTYESGGGALLEWQTCGSVDENASYTWTADHTWNLAGAENLDITHNLSGDVNILNIVGTPSTVAGTAYGAVIRQVNGANTNGFDAAIVIDNADTDLVLADGILITSSTGAITDAIDVSDSDIINAINIGTNLLVASGDSINDFSGNGLQVSGNALTISVQGNKGLEVDASGLSLVDCSTDQVLKYNASSQWACAADSTGAGTIDFDNIYANDSDKTLAINNASGLTYNLTTTGDFIVQDNGNTAFAVMDNGEVVIGNGLAGRLLISDGSSNYVTLTSSGVTVDYELVLPAAAGGTSQCLKTDASVSSQLVFGSCAGSGGGADTVGGIDSVSKALNGAVISSSTLYMQTADDTYPGLVSTIAQDFAGTKNFLGGLTIENNANLVTSNLGIEFTESTSNPSCSVGDYKIYADTTGGANVLKKCQNGTVSNLDTTGASVTLDGVYAADPDKELLVNAAAGLIFDLTTTGDFLIQDNNVTIANFDNNGGITFTPNGASDVTLSFDDDSQLIINGSLTNSGALEDINLTFVADAAGDTVSALNIDVTSANDTVSDIVYGLNIGNLTGAGANTSERALRIGSGWDEAIDVNGTLISLAELQALDAGISLTSEVTGILPILNGGTNSTTAQGAINNISGLTTNGDLLYHNGSNSTRLPKGSDTQCLTSNTTTIVWGGCGGGDNITVNSTAATDLNFLNVASTAGVAGSTWNLATASNPDDITLTISAASGTVAGVVTANAQTLGGAKTFSGGISSNGLTSTNGLTSSGAITFSGLNCTTFANGGKLTTNASGVVSCANDVSGGGTIVKSGTVSVTEGIPALVTFGGTTFSATPRCTVSPQASGFAWVSTHTGTTSITISWDNNSGGQPATSTVEWICTDGANADLAEIYSSNDTKIRPGDLVSIDPELKYGVKMSNGRYDKHLMGIVSTEPAITIGGSEGEGVWQVAVALAGRVPVKVSSENGPIKAGDWLTSSSTPGVAMKATKAGPVVGQAKSDLEGSERGLVMAFVNYGYFNGTSVIDQIEQDENETPEAYRARILNSFMSGPSQDRAALDLSDITTDRLVAGLEIITPKLTADTVVLNKIESVDAQIIEIDEDVRVNGTLYADKIEAKQIVGLEILTNKIDRLSSNIDALDSENSKLKDQFTYGDTESGVLSGNDLGIMLSNGVLTLSNAKILNLEVVENLVAKGVFTVEGNATFQDKVAFKGRTTFNSDTGGFAKVTKGQSSVDVMFENPYETAPSISVTNSDGQFVSYAYQKILENPKDPKNLNVIGFKIVLNSPAEKDVEFSWTALSISGPSVSQVPF